MLAATSEVYAGEREYRPHGSGVEGGPMDYQKPVLRSLGSLAGLTMGHSGSCPDGSGQNNSVRDRPTNCKPGMAGH